MPKAPAKKELSKKSSTVSAKSKPIKKEVAIKKAKAYKKLSGNTFVVTGKFAVQRKDLESFIKANGGSIAASVTAKTNYLIDSESLGKETTKSKKAKELGV